MRRNDQIKHDRQGGSNYKIMNNTHKPPEVLMTSVQTGFEPYKPKGNHKYHHSHQHRWKRHQPRLVSQAQKLTGEVPKSQGQAHKCTGSIQAKKWHRWHQPAVGFTRAKSGKKGCIQVAQVPRSIRTPPHKKWMTKVGSKQMFQVQNWQKGSPTPTFTNEWQSNDRYRFPRVRECQKWSLSWKNLQVTPTAVGVTDVRLGSR